MSAEVLRRAATQMREKATAVKPLGHNYDMGGNRQDETWALLRYIPSSLDGMIRAEADPAAVAHFMSWHPAVALAVADWLDFEAEKIEDGIVFDIDGPAEAVARAHLGES